MKNLEPKKFKEILLLDGIDCIYTTAWLHGDGEPAPLALDKIIFETRQGKLLQITSNDRFLDAFISFSLLEKENLIPHKEDEYDVLWIDLYCLFNGGGFEIREIQDICLWTKGERTQSLDMISGFELIFEDSGVSFFDATSDLGFCLGGAEQRQRYKENWLHWLGKV